MLRNLRSVTKGEVMQFCLACFYGCVAFTVLSGEDHRTRMLGGFLAGISGVWAGGSHR